MLKIAPTSSNPRRIVVRRSSGRASSVLCAAEARAGSVRKNSAAGRSRKASA